MSTMTDDIYQRLSMLIKDWGKELGFQAVGITDTQLGEHESHLASWLADDYHGEMKYMAAHGTKRSRPKELVPGTERIICVRLDYLKDHQAQDLIASDSNTDQKAYVARYALGRDYHKVIRKRLLKLWQRIEHFLGEAEITHHQARVFTDSAPILEKALAEKAGLGWIGKNTLLMSRDAGSWFFLGEIFTDIPLTLDAPEISSHCGSCTACTDVCPTDAFVAPYQLDATRCISYLTIEHSGAIPLELRKKMGNRIFGCDDCQIFCPWNKFANISSEPDFSPRHKLDSPTLLALFEWSEETFLKNTEGSAIRRTGYQGWTRNIAIALGNAPYDSRIIEALSAKARVVTTMVQEHIAWAIEQQHQAQINGLLFENAMD
ncbi:tRNA epoxyqueuosine(34) reductase QueG [Pseudomonadales bacterium]|nr:tRNA epoxyqueuosine(34) reductase QueG [Pseudomonadales bacterium]